LSLDHLAFVPIHLFQLVTVTTTVMHIHNT